MNEESALEAIKKEWHGTWRSYAIGFFTSILLTAFSFFIVATRIFSGSVLVYMVVTLALLQAIVQLLFFLHVGKETKPRYETLVFYFMIMVLLIICLGSLWIMSDLNARMMPEMPKAPKVFSYD